MRASPPLLLLFLLHVLHADDTLATATTSPPSSLPLCRGDAYLAGAWVHDPSKTRAYPCCSAKGEASEMNDPTTAHCLKHDKAFPIYLGNYTRAEYSSSSTAPGARYVSRFDKYVYHSGKYPRVMGNGCSCQHAARAAGRPDDFVTEAERYTWRPTHCTLPPFNGAQFCDALGNRTLLLAGDSTMQQSAVALMSLLVAQDPSLPCLPQVLFELSDMIVYHPSHERGEPWLQHVKRHWPDIVVLSAVARYDHMAVRSFGTSGADKDLDYFFPKFRQDLEYLRGHHCPYPPATVLFKTENPGHQGCFGYKGPVTTWRYENHTGDARFDKYHWDKGRLIDGYIRRFVADDGRAQAQAAPHKAPKSARSGGGTSTARAGGRTLEEAPEKGQEGQPPPPPPLPPPPQSQSQPQPQPQRLRRAVRLGMLDVTPLYLRPDAHPPSEIEPDCLHYCIPGPLDIFAQVLLLKLMNGEV